MRGFPTLFFKNGDSNQTVIYGTKPYEAIEITIARLTGGLEKRSYQKGVQELLHHFDSLTVRELAELSETDFENAEKELESLVDKNFVQRIATRNGNLYRKIDKKYH